MIKSLRDEPAKYLVTGCAVFLSIMVIRSMFPFDYARFVLNYASGLGLTVATLAFGEMLYQRVFLGRRRGWKSWMGLGGIFGTTLFISMLRLSLEYKIGDKFLE